MRQDVVMSKRKRRRFSPEEIADAVRLARELGSARKAGEMLDISGSSVSRWVQQADIDEGNGPEGALTSEEREELRRLRRENRILKMERDFAKKAAAFFAKDLDPPTS